MADARRLDPLFSSLLPLSADEDALIRLLRADPDQQRHLVLVGEESWDVTVQHPIAERVHGQMLECAVLDLAIERELDAGRYRLADDNTFERTDR